MERKNAKTFFLQCNPQTHAIFSYDLPYARVISTSLAHNAKTSANNVNVEVNMLRTKHQQQTLANILVHDTLSNICHKIAAIFDMSTAKYVMYAFMHLLQQIPMLYTDAVAYFIDYIVISAEMLTVKVFVCVLVCGV